MRTALPGNGCLLKFSENRQAFTADLLYNIYDFLTSLLRNPDLNTSLNDKVPARTSVIEQ